MAAAGGASGVLDIELDELRGTMDNDVRSPGLRRLIAFGSMQHADPQVEAAISCGR